MNQSAIVAAAERVGRDDFYRDSHRVIFQSIIDLYNRGEPVDMLTVSDDLAVKGVLEQSGGKAYIHTIASSVPSVANAGRYADMVREASILRSLVQTGARIADLGYERTGEVKDLLDQAEQMVFEISQQRIRGEFREMASLVSEQFDRIEELTHKKKSVTGVPSGFPDLDKLTSGFQPSNLIILAARPAMGKTAFALDIAQNAAIKHDVPVAIFSLEMSDADLAQRMIARQGRLDSHKLRTGSISPEQDWPKVTEACNILEKAPIFVDDTASINMLEIKAKARRLASKKKLGLVIVDYLQLMDSPDINRNQNREQEIAKISRSLKIMAKDLEVPVVAISQLSRSPEGRKPPRPILSDLRESGAIEQDADIVMFIYRPRNENGELDSTAELIVAKHRNGPTRNINLTFLEQYTSFSSAPSGYQSPNQ
ncbi:MAG: replicative DNA helicase [Gaiellales bacterium]|nr:MAG: replicative DNA helicase [Gaiellales bacterium]